MRIRRLYLDTSVLGGNFDDEWMRPTQELWRQMEYGQWQFFTSVVTAEEPEKAPIVFANCSERPSHGIDSRYHRRNG